MQLLNLDSLIVLLYLAATLFIGIYTGRNIKSIKEYAVGNYSFSTPTLIATITATYLGAGYTIGIHEMVYQQGLMWVFILLGEINEIFLLNLFAAHIFRFHGSLSAAEILGRWYGIKGRIIGGLCAISRSIGVIGFQITAIGYLFHEFFQVSPMVGIIISAGIVVLYASFGGIKAVTYTDVIQFCFFVVAIPLIASVMLGETGGYQGLINKLPAEHLKLFPNYETPTAYIVLFLFFAIPFFDPALIQRVLMAKDQSQIIKSFRSTAVVTVLFYLTCGQIALCAFALNPTLDANNVLYHVINNYLPIGIKGIGITGLLSVVMSTADSYLNTASVIVIHDIVSPLRKKPLTNKQELLITKITTFVIGSSAILVAINFKSMTELMLKVDILWAPIAAVPLYAAIIGIKSNFRIFLFSSITGGIVLVAWSLFDLESKTTISPVMPGFAGSLLAFATLTFYYAKFAPHKLIVAHKESEINEVIESNYYLNIKKSFSYFILKVKHIFTHYPKYLPTLKNLAYFSNRRVSYFGAQYKLFGTFAIASFFMPYFMWSNKQGSVTFLSQDVSIVLRFVAGLLAVGLLTQDTNSKKENKYLPLYWHFTLMYSLPFLTTFLFFYNHNFFHEWLINTALSLFLLAMLVDWLSFILIIGIGSSLGYVAQSIICGPTESSVILEDPYKVYLFLYVAFFSTLIGMLFSRKKELIHKLVVDLLEIKVKESTFQLERRTRELERNKVELEQKQAELEKALSIKNNLLSELEQKQEELEKALSIKNTLLNNISHEIRAPIYKINSLSQALNNMWQETDENSKYQDIIQIAKNSMRLAKFVNKLLDMSKFNLGKMRFSFERINLIPIMEDMIEECKSLYLNNKKISIYFKNNRLKEIVAFADEGRICQLLRNIFTNAITYTPEGTIKLEVNVNNNTINKSITVSVTDSGIGIHNGELEKIFEPFYQSSSTVIKSSGTGLGLAICKEIVEAHNGEIWAENVQSGGAKFSFTLPVEYITMQEDEVKATNTFLYNKKMTNAV